MFSRLSSRILRLLRLTRTSLRIKLLLIFIAVSVIPLSMIGIISYLKAFTTIWNNTAASTIQVAEQLNRNIEDLFADSEKFFEIGNTMASLEFLTNSNYDRHEEILNLFKVYKNSYKFKDSIKGIHIIRLDGKGIGDAEGSYSLGNSLKTFSSLKDIVAEPDKIHILQMHIPDYSRQEPKKMVISIGKAILDDDETKVLGLMVIDMDPKVFDDFCNNMRIGKLGYFFIVDKNGSAVCWPKTGGEYLVGRHNYLDIVSQGQNGSFVENVVGEKTFFVYNTSVRTGWKIIGKVPLADLMKDAYEIRNLTAMVCVLCIIMAVVFNYFISDRLTLPLRNMKEKMKLAESGDLTVRVENKNSDEIADLGLRFNRMIEKIKILMENSVREQENLKKAELKIMQAQINPHFLYNTLDTIMWMATSRLNEQVVELVDALSSFFRLSLSKGNEWISVRDEVEHVKNYLIIQKMRYMDILDYEIDVDEKILDYKVMKLLLQPLVENALYHGIKNKRLGGLIKISGRMLPGDNDIQFDIFDNGAGISESSLKEITGELENQSTDIKRKDRGFGLYNVNQRIKLYYGIKYGLSIKSELSEWTDVTMVINAVR